MKIKALKIDRKSSKNAICVGIGLVALDVILNGNENSKPKLLAGGSCGNTLTILSFLGWKSYPIARLSSGPSSKFLLSDLKKHQVYTALISQTTDGSTPIIIHRILKDKENKPKHRFEFKVPGSKEWLPSFKPVLSSKVEDILSTEIKPKVFYIDRVSRATIDLAKQYKEKGSLIFFEPSSISEPKQFNECLKITDILKFSNDRIPEFKELYPNRQCSIEIETLGANGLLFRSFKSKSEDWIFLPAIHIEGAIDSAGAGDWCSAGIIHGLFENLLVTPEKLFASLTVSKILDILRFGQFLGALNCYFYGARGLMYNLNYNELAKAYGEYCKSKKIAISKVEPGFQIGKTPFNFKMLLDGQP